MSFGGRRARIFTWPRLRTAPLMLAGAVLLCAAPASGQGVSRDSYTHRGQSLGLTIHLDSLALWPGNGVSAQGMENALTGLGLTRVRELPERVFVFALEEPVSRDSIQALARAAERRLADGLAGPLTRLDRVPGWPWGLTDQLWLRFVDGTPVSRIDSLNAALGVNVVSRDSVPPLTSWVVQVPRAAGDVLDVLHRYDATPIVAAVNPNMLGGAARAGPVPAPGNPAIPRAETPTVGPPPPAGSVADPFYPRQWHLDNPNGADIDAPQAWSIENGGPGTVIAIIELTGTDPDHPDYKANLGSNPGCVVGNTAGCDLTAKTDWHGTAVAGLAAATGDNGIGVKGVCPECSLMLITTWNPLPATKATAFEYALANGADVINASWGMFRFTELQTAVELAANGGAAGIPVIAAVGNKDQDMCASGDWLVALPEVFAVGASSDTDTRLPAGFGDCLDVLAPGGVVDALVGPDPPLVGIVTTDSPGSAGYNTGFAAGTDPYSSAADKLAKCPVAGSEISDNDYTICFGATSAAAPITAGVAGLLLSADPSLSRSQVYNILRNTAEKIDAPHCGYVSGVSHLCGWGRVDAYAALADGLGKKKVTTTSGYEVGVRLGVTVLASTTDRTTVNLPGGGPQAVPSAHVARVTSSSLVELQLGYRRDSGTAGTTTELVAAFQPALFVSGDLYAGPNVAARWLSTTTSSSTQGAYGAALGYRWEPRPHVSLRLEARYRFWSGLSTHESGLALVGSVLL